MGVTESGKHSSLLRKSEKYCEKSFIVQAPGLRVYSVSNLDIRIADGIV
jgi:hypothetical protein